MDDEPSDSDEADLFRTVSNIVRMMRLCLVKMPPNELRLFLQMRLLDMDPGTDVGRACWVLNKTIAIATRQ